jgi:outer membrane immunogenic protein
MKKYLLSSIAAISMAISASSSDAADLMDAPIGYDWSGAYIGGHVGGGWLDATDVTFGGGNVDSSGIIGGVLAGYNVQAGEFLLGVESDVSFGDFDGGNAATGGFITKITPNAIGTIRGRIGLTFDRALVFATGGLMIANMEADHTGGGPGDKVDQTHYSFVLGGGVEWAVTDSIRVRGEYLYSDLGSETYGFFGGGDPHVLTINDLHIARAAVIWNF